jgi:hypothetical protein
VTASMAWPNFHREMETEVENQVAASAVTRTPNLHRAQQSLIEECGWKGGDRVGLGAQEEQRKDQKSRATAPSFRAEWWQSGPRRQGFADAAKNAPLTAPGRSANPSARKEGGF